MTLPALPVPLRGRAELPKILAKAPVRPHWGGKVES